MIITTLEQLEESKKIVLEMKSQATNEFVISVFDEMLKELNTKGVECVYSPSYLSIIRLGYDIFKVLPR
jgi:hypothetical protein